jgi:AcrR family transcriptional regulator
MATPPGEKPESEVVETMADVAGEGRREEIIAVAGQLLEAHGPDGLTMRAIAAELGIRAPSLYKHVADKRELEVALIADGFAIQADEFERAVRTAEDSIEAFARVYRAWALAHRHLYRLMTDQPLPRDRLPEGLEERAARPLIQACGGSVDRARAAWAFAHGMVTLELADRFPQDADIDAAWRVGIGAIAASITNTR